MELAAQFGRGAPHADARRAQREHERRKGFVGPPQPVPIDMQPTRIKELEARLASLGGPAHLALGIASSMRWLLALCRDYARGRVMVWPFVKWEAEVAERCDLVLAAIERADVGLKAWLAEAARPPGRLGVQIGDKVLVSAQDYSALTGSTLDAAQKQFREGNLGKAIKIGKYWYVELAELLRRRSNGA